ncbi:NB-ARC domain-containing protein [Streptomyces marianii]|uniref:NB-ARC domain-containing protein n=1 Tax=Streptomyces marianii TaxID=1817406 RepID=UPI001486F302|nr:NB-ARC domain-containing protein [Streptomyces marianii]
MFVNRSMPLRVLDEWLAADDPTAGNIWLVHGMPGIGKTTTVLAWARQARDRFPDGQLFVHFPALRDQVGADVSEAVATCLRALGVGGEFLPDSLAARAELFRAVSADRRLLLVLDNVACPAQIRPLISRGSGSVVVATSRSRLGELVGDGARFLHLQPLSAEDGLALLADRCGQQLIEADRPAAVRLVELCGGVPLALQMVAALLRNGPKQTVNSLLSELESTAEWLQGIPPRYPAAPLADRAVGAALDLVYQQLPPPPPTRPGSTASWAGYPPERSACRQPRSPQILPRHRP